MGILGGELDTNRGPTSSGHIPDIALRRLLANLALILASFAWTKDAPDVEAEEER